MQAADWRFGVEIECKMPAGRRFAAGQYHRGRQIPALGEWSAAGWNAQLDGSVHGGLEVVSPVLSGEEGLFQVWAVVEYLASVGTQVDRECGLHVHVDASKLTRDQVSAVQREFLKVERAFYALNAEEAAGRWQSIYCKPLSRMGLAAAESDRYLSLNIQNWLRWDRTGRRDGKPTLEFRLFAGSMDPRRVMTAVLLCVSLVAAVTNGETLDAPADAVGQTRVLIKRAVQKHRIVSGHGVSDVIRYLLEEVGRAPALP
jgi:hypothetical protein